MTDTNQNHPQQVFILQKWQFRNLQHGNDYHDILGVFKKLEEAQTLADFQIMTHLFGQNVDLIQLLFPRYNKIELIANYYAPRISSFLVNKILFYMNPPGKRLCPHTQTPPTQIPPTKIEWEEFSKNTWIDFRPRVESVFSDLMILRTFLITHSQYDYRNHEIMVFFNRNILGKCQRLNHDAFRITLHHQQTYPNHPTGDEELPIENNDNNELPIGFYIGPNLVDIEDCNNRARHFCHSFQIYPKNLT